MKKLTLLTSICFLFVLISCEKDNDDGLSKENYIRCNINGEPFLVYENYSLNKEDTTYTFSFSFGTCVHTGLTDTVFEIGGTLNRNAVKISFPWTDHPQKFPIYRTIPTILDASGSYQYIAKSIVNGKLTVFHTKDFSYSNNYKSEVVGEIVVSYVNLTTREFQGTFWFKSFGYQFPLSNGGSISFGSEITDITQGSFHYKVKKH